MRQDGEDVKRNLCECATILGVTLATVANLIAGVLITQLVLGGLSLLGFYHGGKRFISTEFPAQISRIDNRLEGLDKHVSALATELREMRRDVDRHEVILERRDRGGGDDLDDTRAGRERRRRT